MVKKPRFFPHKKSNSFIPPKNGQKTSFHKNTCQLWIWHTCWLKRRGQNMWNTLWKSLTSIQAPITDKKSMTKPEKQRFLELRKFRCVLTCCWFYSKATLLWNILWKNWNLRGMRLMGRIAPDWLIGMTQSWCAVKEKCILCSSIVIGWNANTIWMWQTIASTKTLEPNHQIVSIPFS